MEKGDSFPEFRRALDDWSIATKFSHRTVKSSKIIAQRCCIRALANNLVAENAQQVICIQNSSEHSGKVWNRTAKEICSCHICAYKAYLEPGTLFIYFYLGWLYLYPYVTSIYVDI